MVVSVIVVVAILVKLKLCPQLETGSKQNDQRELENKRSVLCFATINAIFDLVGLGDSLLRVLFISVQEEKERSAV